VGDTIEIIHPSGNRKVKLAQMKDKNGASIDVAAGSPTHVWIPVDGPAEGGLLARMF
jgi:putative protease